MRIQNRLMEKRPNILRVPASQGAKHFKAAERMTII